MGNVNGRKLKGHMYIAKAPCGRVSAMAWDEPDYVESTAEDVARYIARGDSVERVAVYEGDPQPEVICGRDQPCACKGRVL